MTLVIEILPLTSSASKMLTGPDYGLLLKYYRISMIKGRKTREIVLRTFRFEYQLAKADFIPQMSATLSKRLVVELGVSSALLRITDIHKFG